MRGFLLVVVALLLLTACGNSEERGEVDTGRVVETAEAEDTEEPEPETEPTKRRATATVAPDSFTVGDTVETEAGNTITVISFEAPIPPQEFFEPEPGNVQASIDVEACAGPNPDSGSAGVNPFDFELQMPDNTRRTYSFSSREPALNDTTLLANDCVRGFVGFEIPEGQRPKFVIFEGSSIVKWAVP